MQSKPEIAFYKDLADTLSYWTRVGVEAMSDSRSDLTAFDHHAAFEHLRNKLADEKDRQALALALRAILHGHTHSILVSLDGGTAMAETQRVVIQIDDGKPFTDELHEEFESFLLRYETKA